MGTRIRRTNAEFEGCAVLHFLDADYADNADFKGCAMFTASYPDGKKEIRVIRVIRV